ncbi:MAG: Holliday junction resolvase RuvX [Thermodesulfobacteriota bacterium]
MRYLGIDYGLKRVGLALTDSAATLATPLATINRTTRQALFGILLEYIEHYRIEAVVIGLPYDLEGKETLATRQARNFAASLGRRIIQPIHFVDEVLTSQHAADVLHQANLPSRKQKAVLDQQAAVAILESFLASGPENIR